MGRTLGTERRGRPVRAARAEGAAGAPGPTARERGTGAASARLVRPAGHDDVVVTNQNKALRTVPVAGDATLSCSTIVNGGEEPCHGYADPAVWVRIQGGVATKVVTQLWWE